jgi:hypothetical protein
LLFANKKSLVATNLMKMVKTQLQELLATISINIVTEKALSLEVTEDLELYNVE